MRIIFTGGGTGGHFYPIIAVAEKINELVNENKLLRPQLYYFSTEPYDVNLLFENNITFYKVSAGKIRKQKSPENIILNFIDLFKTFFGVISSIIKVFSIYPDVVFGKGGYASFPVILSARLLNIPVIIHESDSKPGKVNSWAGKFARKIAISYPDAIKYFDPKKTAYTGNPIRKAVMEKQTSGSHEFFGLNPNIPTLFVIGGSLGSRFINNIILDSLSELTEKYQIIHQTGKSNFEVVKETADVVLDDKEKKLRYKFFPYMNSLAMRVAGGVSDLVISRAGSTIFEIANWGRASIIIPIPEPTSHDQKSNAFAYARTGSCSVIEEESFSKGVFLAEIERILSQAEIKNGMEKSAILFSRTDSSHLIAEAIIAIGLEHEK